MGEKKDDYKTMLFDDDGYTHSTRRGICRLVGVPPGREEEENGQFVMFFLLYPL